MSYGIKNGQIYHAADGRSGSYVVLDCETYADVHDVVVKSLGTGEIRRIDAFKLARVRYYLDETLPLEDELTNRLAGMSGRTVTRIKI